MTFPADKLWTRRRRACVSDPIAVCCKRGEQRLVGGIRAVLIIVGPGLLIDVSAIRAIFGAAASPL